MERQSVSGKKKKKRLLEYLRGPTGASGDAESACRIGQVEAEQISGGRSSMQMGVAAR